MFEMKKKVKTTTISCFQLATEDLPSLGILLGSKLREFSRFLHLWTLQTMPFNEALTSRHKLLLFTVEHVILNRKKNISIVTELD